MAKFVCPKNSKLVLDNSISFKIFFRTIDIPSHWDDLAVHNIFLSKSYFEVLEKSAPANMQCQYIGFYENKSLVGIAISQFLDGTQLDSFGERERCFRSYLRDFVFKKFASRVLIMGNNMLTGSNSYFFSDKINKSQALGALQTAALFLKENYKKQGKKIHVTTFKDFYENEITHFQLPEFQKTYQFSTQPNMVFEIDNNWKSEQDYVFALSKKYRDQYKRARKKASGIEKRKLDLLEIIENEQIIYDLYFHVAKNAPFNTFFLSKNHFRVLKENLTENFLFYGYFIEDKLIGFNTLIKNGDTLETYFLGYDETIQREKMLYLNMLYDMIAYSINKGFKEIIFARTALEIKSSVGAKPIKMFGLMSHSNAFFNAFLHKIFPFFEPKTIWKERNPFK